jgi:hypothetical protein
MLPDMLENALDVAVVCEVDPVVDGVVNVIVMSTVV